MLLNHSTRDELNEWLPRYSGAYVESLSTETERCPDSSRATTDTLAPAMTPFLSVFRDLTRQDGEGPIIIVQSLESGGGDDDTSNLRTWIYRAKLRFESLLNAWVREWQWLTAILFPVNILDIFVDSIFIDVTAIFATVATLHLRLLWLALIVLPLEQRLQLSNLKVIGATVFIFELFHSDYYDFGHVLDLKRPLLGSIFWSVVATATSLRVSDKRTQTWCAIVLAVCGNGFGILFVPFVMLVASVVPLALLVPWCLVTRNPNHFLRALSCMCPCLPVREIKQMEMDYVEELHETEDVNHDRLDRQIAELGRPDVSDESVMARLNQKGKRATCMVLVLCIWNLAFVVWFMEIVALGWR